MGGSTPTSRPPRATTPAGTPSPDRTDDLGREPWPASREGAGPASDVRRADSADFMSGYACSTTRQDVDAHGRHGGQVDMTDAQGSDVLEALQGFDQPCHADAGRGAAESLQG